MMQHREIINKSISYKMFLKKYRNDKNEYPAVYFLINNGEIIYIGKSKNLYSRIVHHRDKEFDYITVLNFLNDAIASKSEIDYIGRFNPKFNFHHLYTDNKLQKLINEHGISQSELANGIFMDAQLISQYCIDNRNPSFQTMMNISKYVYLKGRKIKPEDKDEIMSIYKKLKNYFDKEPKL